MAKEKTKTADPTLVKGIKGRASFPYLFKKDNFDRYSLSILIEPGSPDDLRMQEAVKAAAKAKWPGKDKDGNPKYKKILKKLQKTGKVSYAEGDDDREENEGMMVIKTGSSTKVPVKDRDGKEDLTAEDGRIYSGCYISAIVNVWAQDNDFGRRINVSLKGVQFWKDGEAFSGVGVAKDEDFEDLSDGSDDDDEDDEDEDDNRSSKKKNKAKSKKKSRRDEDDEDDLA